jgi:hypothetical protein
VSTPASPSLAAAALGPCAFPKMFDVVIVEHASPSAGERWAKLVQFLLNLEPKQ